MPTLRRVDPERREELLQRVTEFVRELKATLPVEQVYLFGSFAKGEVHEGSDIDLLIIGAFSERLPYRILSVMRLTELPIEPVVYTRAEFEQMKQQGNPFVMEVLRTGTVL